MLSPVLLIAIPLGFSFLAPLLKKGAKYIPPIAMLFNLILSILLVPQVMRKPIIVLLGGGWPPPFCINLVASPLGILLALLISLVGFLVSIYAIAYIKEGATEKYHTLYLLLLTGATGIVLTGDIFNLFVFFEILCISSYALVAYNGDKHGLESAVKYLIQGSIGSSFILIGIALLYGLFGTLNMADIANNISYHSLQSPTLYVALAFFITGFGVEGAIFPLNAWLPDAHSSAPSTISAILSGIAIKTGVYAIARVTYTLFSAKGFMIFIATIGIITLLIGEMSALGQKKDIKRMLAYSSIGQIGLIIFAFGIATYYGIFGALFQLVNHALAKSLLFLASGYMIYRVGSKELSAFEGLGKKMPLSSLVFTIGAFSLIGLPPFAGFMSKISIISAGIKANNTALFVFVIIVLFATIIEGCYFFRVVQNLYFKKSRDPAHNCVRDGCPTTQKSEMPISALIPIIILALLIVAIGIYPRLVTGIIESAAIGLMDKVGYIHQILGIF
ncbi:hypothetical protein KAW65_00855 [candidate division WOR-3 bacterium]|nr:hypothetical protein [candidate division WOR-3 bacterium]